MFHPDQSSRLAIREYPKNSLPIMEQKWRDLLFLHWEYDPLEIQKTLPQGLHVDLFKGKAYIGLTPFFLKDVRLKIMPSLPGLSHFLEVNLRTYVYDEKGMPGVWFYSLDANSFLGVQLASSIYHLPYFYAQINTQLTATDEIVYRCQRQNQDLAMELIYKSKGKELQSNLDSLEFFLIERYLLFADKGEGQLATARVFHSPYPLYEAELPKWDDVVFQWNGLKKPGRKPDHICFSPGVDTEIFAITTSDIP
jgi:uncharacterized protein YqjF (DUF2071 family)